MSERQTGEIRTFEYKPDLKDENSVLVRALKEMAANGWQIGQLTELTNEGVGADNQIKVRADVKVFWVKNGKPETEETWKEEYLAIVNRMIDEL